MALQHLVFTAARPPALPSHQYLYAKRMVCVEKGGRSESVEAAGLRKNNNNKNKNKNQNKKLLRNLMQSAFISSSTLRPPPSPRPLRVRQRPVDFHAERRRRSEGTTG
ncbi:unnamed protein product [Pleuronectes platessa]|uniref:Uncharacterized protein n=1 Tax=Pleuronectes platessa TaxID=8262 RepID=A0A9N7TQR7_PLEPL|nr:unnamed protein product [Pleuronectes platessa]